jgi:hypothetical protein
MRISLLWTAGIFQSIDNLSGKVPLTRLFALFHDGTQRTAVTLASPQEVEESGCMSFQCFEHASCKFLSAELLIPPSRARPHPILLHFIPKDFVKLFRTVGKLMFRASAIFMAER